MNYLSLSMLQLVCKKIMLECHLGHGTFVLLSWQDLVLLVEGPGPISVINEVLTSLPVISYLGVKGHLTRLWCCFQSSILYFKFFFQNQFLGNCCFLHKGTSQGNNRELLSCPVLPVFQCPNRSENSHPPNAELQQLQFYILHSSCSLSLSATFSGEKHFSGCLTYFRHQL